MENARIWYTFKNIPELVGCIEAVVRVLDDAADGLMTAVIVGDGTNWRKQKENVKLRSRELRHDPKHSPHIPIFERPTAG